MSETKDYWNAALDSSGRDDMTALEARNYCHHNDVEPYLIRPCEEDDGLRRRNLIQENIS